MNPFSVLFEQALKYAKRRKIVLPDEYYHKMTARQRKQAVSIAGLAKLSLISLIMGELNKTLQSGGTFKDFQQNAKGVLPQHRLDNIFRTNIQMAYAQGRYEQQQMNKKRRPYLMYSAINDKRTRHDHARLDGVIRPIDDSFWDKHTPPIDYRCRCTVLALTEKEAKEKGVTSVDDLPKNVQTFGSGPKDYSDDLGKLIDDVPVPIGGDEMVWQALKGEIKEQQKLSDLLVDFSNIKADSQEVERLLVDLLDNKPKLSEAMAGAEYQAYFGVKLTRPKPEHNADGTPKAGFDYWVDDTQKLDFMFTMHGYPQRKIDNLNKFFAHNDEAWNAKKDDIIKHLNKADIVPLDLRYLTDENRSKIIDFVLSLSQEQRQKIILIQGKL